jgi:YfiH family protein
MNNLEVIRPAWSVHPRVRAAFTLRTGGVSAAPFNALNLGAHVGDDRASVAENRRRVGVELDLPSEPAWLQQVHGVRVVGLDADAKDDAASTKRAAVGAGLANWAGATNDGADAAITRASGRVCAILVADCIPVLFAARDGSAVAAAHAGWRGLAGGVLEATVAALGCEPAGLSAWLGPGIGRAHFEVGDDVRDAFLEDTGFARLEDAGSARQAGRGESGGAEPASAFERNPRGRWQCDLALLARRRLAQLGVTDVHGGSVCTYADATRFFSFRRDGQCGRMAALIWLQGPS